jgi:hypothetical protein
MRTTVVYDLHEYTIETLGIFNSSVILKVDNKECKILNKGSTWNYSLFFEYEININNQKKKLSIILLNNRFLMNEHFLVFIYEKSVIIGIDQFKDYKVKYAKYLEKRKKLFKENQILRIIILEWKKLVGYLIFGVLVLMILNMLRFLAIVIFTISILILFGIIGIWDDKNLKKEINENSK